MTDFDIRKYLKPEYGGYRKKRKYEPDHLYTCTHQCGVKIKMKGQHFINGDGLFCECSYGSGPLFNWKIEH